METIIYSPVKLFRKAQKGLRKLQSPKHFNGQHKMDSSEGLTKSSSLPVLPIISARSLLQCHRLSLTIGGEDIEDECDCNNIFKWIDQSILPEVEAKNLKDVIEGDIIHIKGGEIAMAIALKFEAFYIIARVLSLAYLNILLKKYLESKTAIRSAKRLLRKCWKNHFIHRDYVSGISFVILTIEDFYMEQMSSDIDQLSVHLISCAKSSTELWVPTFGGIPESGYMSKYNSLSEKSQVAVLGMKYYVMELFVKDFNQRINLLNHILVKDRDYFEWYLCLASCLRTQRYEPALKSSNKAYVPSPSARERDLINKAAKLNPNHPMCMLAESMYIAEISKTHRWNSHLVYGDIILKDVEHVEDFLHYRINSILQLYNLSSGVNLGIVQLFNILSRQKDNRLVKERLEWTILLHPNCGQAYHQLGCYYMQQSEEKNIELAGQLLTLAFEYNQSAFPALIELLNLYLVNTNENGAIIMKLVSKYLRNPLSSWSGFHIGSLLFIEGCYVYMDTKLGGTKNSVLCWISSFKACENTWKYKIATFPHGAYNNKLSLSAIKSAILEQTKAQHISEQDKIILRRMATGSYWYPWSQKRFAL